MIVKRFMAISNKMNVIGSWMNSSRARAPSWLLLTWLRVVSVWSIATLHHPFLSPFPPLMSCDSVRDALLSARFRYFNAIIGSRPLVSSPVPVATTILDIQCSVACYTLSVSLRTSWVQRRNGLFLNCSSCIPGLYRMAMNWHALNQGPHEICYNCRESCREHAGSYGFTRPT